MSNGTENKEDREFVKLAKNVLDALVCRWIEEGNTTHFFESGNPDAIEMKSFFELISEAESFLERGEPISSMLPEFALPGEDALRTLFYFHRKLNRSTHDHDEISACSCEYATAHNEFKQALESTRQNL